MKAVMILSVISIALLINGCCNHKVEYRDVYIPQKCKLQSVGVLELDHKEYNTTNGIISRILHNSDKKSEYIEKLIEAQKVCK
jgi:hypothetical protein